MTACAAIASPFAARAQAPVAIELVLAVDTSTSVDADEYELMMTGIARAFRTPEIVELIGRHDGVAVTLFQWGTRIDPRYAVPWRLLTDRRSVLAFAGEVERLERDPYPGLTAIGKAIRHAVRLFAENGFDGRQRKIDISGDGRNNIGEPPAEARVAADAPGIVINGLPILTGDDLDNYDLVGYYREEIVRGPGAFVEVADEYDDFARAFLRKLQRELILRIGLRAVPHRPI